MTVEDVEATGDVDPDRDDRAALNEAFRGRDTSPGSADDLRRIVLNQRDQIIGAEAELGSARRAVERLERENALLRAALHRARRWPFGWIVSLTRAARAILRRLARAAS